MPQEVAFLDQQFLGNRLSAWVASFIILFLVMLGLCILRLFTLRHLTRLAKTTRTGLDDLFVALVVRTRFVLMLLLAVYIASYAVHLPDPEIRLIRTIAVVAFLIQFALWGNRLITYALTHYLQKRGQPDPASLTTVTTLGYIARGFLWVILLLLALDNVGIKVTGLVAGLGIGGIAVALAAQQVLKDLFASLAIVFDKPFLIGDAIAVDAFQGTVEHIGIKTTRLRSVSGEELVFSNSDLLNSRIRNYRQTMPVPETVLSLSLSYATPMEKLNDAPRLVEEVFRAHPRASLLRAHFRSFGEAALFFEIAYRTDRPNATDVQHAVNLEILERFRREDIQFIALSAQAQPVAGAVPASTPAAGRT